MFSEQIIEGLLWVFMVVCGLFGIFILVSLFILFFAKPDRNGNLTWR